MTERGLKILNHIRENPGISKSDVVRFMDRSGTSSRDTTRKEIESLIRENLLIWKKDKPNSQTYHLLVNPNDDFNRINESISKVQQMAEVIDKKRGPLFVKNMRDKMSKLKQAKIDEFFTRHYEILGSCDEQMISLLHLLIYEIHSKIKPEPKSQILYRRIIELMKQMHIEEEKEDFNHVINELQDRINKLSGLMK